MRNYTKDARHEIGKSAAIKTAILLLFLFAIVLVSLVLRIMFSDYNPLRNQEHIYFLFWNFLALFIFPVFAYFLFQNKKSLQVKKLLQYRDEIKRKEPSASGVVCRESNMISRILRMRYGG